MVFFVRLFYIHLLPLLYGVFIFCHRTDVRTNDALVLAYPKGSGQPKPLYPKSKELGFTGFFYKNQGQNRIPPILFAPFYRIIAV